MIIAGIPVFARSSYVVDESVGLVSVLVSVLNGEYATFRVTTVNGTAVGREHSISSNVIILMMQDIQHLLVETTRVLRWILCLVHQLHSIRWTF